MSSPMTRASRLWWLLLGLALAPLTVATPSGRPYHLQVNYQRSPALGVGKLLRFSWAVPAPALAAPSPHVHVQSSYRIVITALDGTAGSPGPSVVWDSGTVNSSASVNVEADGHALGLLPGTAYGWTVGCDGGAPSAPARFITGLWHGFDDRAEWIWAPPSPSPSPSLVPPPVPVPAPVQAAASPDHFAHFRHVLAGTGKNATLSRALLFVTAWQEPTMLAAFKFYIGGRLVAIGPGRGEADVLGRNATLIHTPYVTADVTEAVLSAGDGDGTGAGAVLAIAGMAPLFQQPCLLHACTDLNVAGGGILAQLHLRYRDGSAALVVTNSKGGEWRAVPRDAYYRPGAASVSVPELASATAYAKVLEHIDARQDTWAGWRTMASLPLPWPAAVPSSFRGPPGGPIAKMARPLVVFDVPQPVLVRNDSRAGGDYVDYLVDFGREFQGGIVLTVHSDDAIAGTTVRLVAGELLLPNGTTHASTLDSRIDPANTWGFAMNWTLRGGGGGGGGRAQQLVQHEYMIFRYVAMRISTELGPPPSNFSVGAWGVKYEYEASDSSFASDNATLNAVHELARWTLDGGVVDTYTDSNSRERRPYECDGLVASANRLVLQGDAMWGRHSHTWVLAVPTWPVEWMQMAPLLALQDYYATGSTDLFATYEAVLRNRTDVGAVDGTGLVNTTIGRHIVAWDPPPTRDMFVNSAHTTVCSSWAVRGLEALAEMGHAAAVSSGSHNSSSADRYAGEAAALRAAMMAAMWNATSGRFCDGVCSDPVVAGHSGVTTDYFTTFLGLMPTDELAGARCASMAAFGLRRIGDYGAFVFTGALARHSLDDGSALLDALTKCDEDSWCHEMAAFNATMTTEALGTPHATMSHPWGASPVGAIAHGVVGVRQSTAAWSEFVVQPRLATLRFANLTLPTIRGAISVAAKPGRLSVDVPCNTKATLCVMPSGDGGAAPARLLLDGESVPFVVSGRHICTASAVGCAAAPRVLVLV